MAKQGCDVFILAAGFGRRLLPLTENTPKPLVEVGGKPLIEWNLELFGRFGFRRIIVNSFHLAEKLERFLANAQFKDFDITVVRENEILGTGGGIKNIYDLLQCETLLTFNCDIVIDPSFNPKDLLAKHLNSKNSPLATMLLREDPLAEQYGTIGVDSTGRVVEFLGQSFSSLPVKKKLMYTGVQILSKKVFDFMPATDNTFSITQDVYPSFLDSGAIVESLCYQGYWNDAGTPERLLAASQYLSQL